MPIVSSTRAIAAAAAGLMLFAGPASAHPHVWVTVETTVLYGPDQKASGIRHKWTFDELYSTFAVQGLDKKGDGKPTPDDLKELAKLNIESLKEFEYFTFPAVNGLRSALKEPIDYHLEHADGRLSLHFTLPLAEPVAAKDQLAFSVQDPTWFIAFEFSKEKDKAVALGPGAPKGCKAELKAADPSSQTDRLAQAFSGALGQGSNLGPLAAGVGDGVVVTCTGS
jgi:ABC-type uncharacterized transport system substrate-binding protein